ncbi:hypothetical protein ACJX0J_031339, partial [Zea mays]
MCHMLLLFFHSFGFFYEGQDTTIIQGYNQMPFSKLDVEDVYNIDLLILQGAFVDLNGSKNIKLIWNQRMSTKLKKHAVFEAHYQCCNMSILTYLTSINDNMLLPYINDCDFNFSSISSFVNKEKYRLPHVHFLVLFVTEMMHRAIMHHLGIYYYLVVSDRHIFFCLKALTAGDQASGLLSLTQHFLALRASSQNRRRGTQL